MITSCSSRSNLCEQFYCQLNLPDVRPLGLLGVTVCEHQGVPIDEETEDSNGVGLRLNPTLPYLLGSDRFLNTGKECDPVLL